MGIAITKLFGSLLFWLLEALDTILEMFQVLCGIQKVGITGDSGGSERSIINIFLESNVVTQAFLVIFLISVLVCAVCMISAVVKNIVNMKGGERKSNVKIAGQGLGSIIITVAMAGVMVIGITMANTVLIQVDKATRTEETTISQQVFDLCVTESYQYDYSKEIIEYQYLYDESGSIIYEKNEDGTYKLDGDEKIPQKAKDEYGQDIVLSKTYEIKCDQNGNPILVGGWYKKNGSDDEAIKYSASDIVFGKSTVDQVFGVHHKTLGLFEDAASGYTQTPMVELSAFNMFLAYLCACVMLVSLIMMMLSLIKRLYDIVMLFLLLPLISATIPLDDGARFKSWRETVISKVILSYGAVLAVNIFMLIVPLIMSIDFIALGWTTFVSSLFKMFMLIGGALSISGGQLLVSRIFGTSAEEGREMAQGARALLGGVMAAGGLAHGTKNVIFGGTNKYGRHRRGILGGTAKATAGVGNAIGTALGGDAYKRGAASFGGIFGREGSKKSSSGGHTAGSGSYGGSNIGARAESTGRSGMDSPVKPEAGAPTSDWLKYNADKRRYKQEKKNPKKQERPDLPVKVKKPRNQVRAENRAAWKEGGIMGRTAKFIRDHKRYKGDKK